MTENIEWMEIRPRSCGGWIGVFDDGLLRFGVTSPSEAGAHRALVQALARWRELLSDEYAIPD